MGPKHFKWPSFIATVCGVVLLAFGTLLIRESVNEPPYRLIVEPNDGHSRVQFRQPGVGLVSDWFLIKMAFAERLEVTLDSISAPIPGGRIQFADTTILPGRFQLQIADDNFDLMERAIYVNGRPSSWKSVEQRGVSDRD
jgi:hypothetical protein